MNHRYVAITPARDEEQFLPDMIQAMVNQTITPTSWIIIDDGSKDRTGEIIDEASRKYSWIEPKHLARGRAREPGGESVIMRFLPREKWQDVDFIARLDADLFFGADYIEKLLEEFERNPRLGIACGTLLERVRGEWLPVPAPKFHTRGASKIYSRESFEAIGGLEAGLGWDAVDEVKAMMAGFETRNFDGINAYHRRVAGSATGAWRARYLQGTIAYYVGYFPPYALARAALLAFKKPILTGSLMYLAGFWSGYIGRRPRTTEKVIKFIREQQIRRLTFRDSVWQ